MLLDNVKNSYASQPISSDFLYTGKAWSLNTIKYSNQGLTRCITSFAFFTATSEYTDQNHAWYMLLGCPGFYYNKAEYVISAPVTLSYLKYHLDQLIDYVKEASPVDLTDYELPFISQKHNYYSQLGTIEEPEAIALSALIGKTTDSQKQQMLCYSMKSFIRMLYVFKRDYIDSNYIITKYGANTDSELMNRRVEAIRKCYRLQVLGSMAEEYFSYCFSWIFRNLAIFDSKHFYKGSDNHEEFATYDSHNGDLIVCSLLNGPHLETSPSSLPATDHLNIDLKLCQSVSATSLKNFGNSPLRWYVFFSDSGDHVYFVRAITLRKYINEMNIQPIDGKYDVSSFINSLDEFKLFLSKSKAL